jgi:hypothetical protein
MLSADRIDELFNEPNSRRAPRPTVAVQPDPTPDDEWVNVRPSNRKLLGLFAHGIPALEALLELQRDDYDNIRERLSYDVTREAYIPRWHAISNFFYEMTSYAKQPRHTVFVTLLSLSCEKIEILAEFVAANHAQYFRSTAGPKSMSWILLQGNERPADAQDMNEAIERAEALVLLGGK